MGVAAEARSTSSPASVPRCARWLLQPVLVLDPGLASYSSLAQADPGGLLCLYEVGGGEAISSLTLVTLAVGGDVRLTR